MAAVIPGEGTVLKVTISSTLTAIVQVTNISGPTFGVASVETTALDSTAHTFRPSKLVDGGEVSLDIEYDPNNSTHQAFTALLAAPAIVACELIFNDTLTTHSKIAFNAFLTGFEPGGMTVEENLTAAVTLKVTGLPVHSAGTP